mgnify:FL=1
MEEKSQKDKIEQEKDIERQNNENIKQLIDIIGLHSESCKTQEYFEFVKEVRKYRKKINNKKEKLEAQNMLESAYLEKNGILNKKFNNMIKGYEGKSPWIVYAETWANRGSSETMVYIPESYPFLTIVETIARANRAGKYIEQYKWYYSNEITPTGNINEKKIKEHYAIINALYMKNILEHYDNELEYWKHYLKQMVKKIEKIEELE